MVNNFAKLVAVAALGSALVGCSATPEVEDNYQYEEQKQSAAETSQGSATLNMTNDSSNLDGQSKAAMTNEQLKAMLSGKVVYFDYDRSDVRSEFYDIIKLNAEYLNNNPNASVTIAGHCDERGSREYNLALGERRGNSVKNALVVEGVNPNRINVISFGEDMPAVEGHTEAAWAKNRRAEFNY